MNTDTPRTDAAVEKGGYQLLNVAICCRQLERELAEAKRELFDITGVRDQLAADCRQLQKERDEARAVAFKNGNAQEKAEAELAAVTKERNEARQLIHHFMESFEVFDLSEESYDAIEKRAVKLWQVVKERDEAKAECESVHQALAMSVNETIPSLWADLAALRAELAEAKQLRTKELNEILAQQAENERLRADGVRLDALERHIEGIFRPVYHATVRNAGSLRAAIDSAMSAKAPTT